MIEIRLLKMKFLREPLILISESKDCLDDYDRKIVVPQSLSSKNKVIRIFYETINSNKRKKGGKKCMVHINN